MKKATILFLAIVIIPIFGFTQSIENLDYISPFHDGLAAIKKDNHWGFINNKGVIVIDFRGDLLVTKSDDGSYPIFYDNRCIIESKKEGISYFGYIDTSGKTVIKPQFLNTLNFNNGFAIALTLNKEVIAKNRALGKDVVYHRYYQVTIDTKGDVENYLTQDGVNVVLDKQFLRKPPKIESRKLSDSLYAVKKENGKWSVKKLN
jgi:hypothetical protein